MDFLFHSVYDDGQHRKYYNVYKISEDRYLAECHHFNRERLCNADFEFTRDENGWHSDIPAYGKHATYIGGEIDHLNGVLIGDQQQKDSK